MTDYLDQTTDISDEAETAKPNSETPNMIAQMENFMNEQKMNRPYKGNAEVSNADFYPTHNEPVQQGGGMFTTIAPTASLFPYAAMIKMRNENDRINSVLSAKQKSENEWNFKLGSINDPTAQSRMLDLYSNVYSQTKEAQQAKYGNDWVYYTKNDPEIMSRFNKLNSIISGYNENLLLAKTTLEPDDKDDKTYSDPKAKKYAYELRSDSNDIMSLLSSDPKDVEKWYNSISEGRKYLIRQKDSVPIIKEAVENANRSVGEFDEVVKNAGGLNSVNYDDIATFTHKNPFYKLTEDKDGNKHLSYDEKGEENYFMKYLETASGNTYKKDDNGYVKDKNGDIVLDKSPYGEDRYVPSSSWLTMGHAGILHSETEKHQFQETKALDWEKERNDQVDKTKVPTINSSDIPISVGNKKIENPHNFANTPLKIKTAVNVDKNPETNPNGVLKDASITAFGHDAQGNGLVLMRGKATNKYGIDNDVTTIQSSSNYEGELNANYHLVGWNDETKKITKNSKYSTPVTNKGSKTTWRSGDEPENKSTSSKTSSYFIKGKNYSLVDLQKLGYTEAQVEKYKSK